MSDPFANLPPDDPIYEHLPQDARAMSAPTLEDAGFWVLLWAAIHSLLGYFGALGHRTERTAVATEQIATAVQTYTNRPVRRKPLNLEAPDSFNGRPDKVDAFLHALALYFDGQEIIDDSQHIIFALSLVKGGTGDIAADLQRKLIIDAQNGATSNGHIASWAHFQTEFTSYFQYTSSKDEAQKKL
ncbi:hypothetical protein B0H14DRAFT_2459417, partial [Mycena olivaceomarginata]